MRDRERKESKQPQNDLRKRKKMHAILISEKRKNSFIDFQRVRSYCEHKKEVFFISPLRKFDFAGLSRCRVRK